MITVPKEKPVLADLNSFYIDINKLIDYCQEEFISGAVHFKSFVAEGILFFYKEGVVNGVFHDSNTDLSGKAAIDSLVKAGGNFRFTINVYKIDLEWFFFWSNIHTAKALYKDLNSVFTDLEALLNKINVEGNTGYVEIIFNNSEDNGLIFLKNGAIVGSFYSSGKGNGNWSEENTAIIIRTIKEVGGIFNVYKISPDDDNNREVSKEKSLTALNILPVLEQLLTKFEEIVYLDKKQKNKFYILLKNKFREHAEEYPFLDPFAAEFDYNEGKIIFTGQASNEEIAKGVMKCVKELTNELGVLPELTKKLEPWYRKFSVEIEAYGLIF